MRLQALFPHSLRSSPTSNEKAVTGIKPKSAIRPQMFFIFYALMLSTVFLFSTGLFFLYFY